MQTAAISLLGDIRVTEIEFGLRMLELKED